MAEVPDTGLTAPDGATGGATAGGQPAGSLADLVERNASSFPTRVVARRRTAEGWVDVDAAELCAQVRALAKGLVSAGVRPGDRVGLMSATRYEWMLVDLAVWHAGAVTVPLYESSSPAQVAWILEDSGAVACFVEGRRHARTLAEVAGRLPALRRVWGLADEAVGQPVLDPGDRSDAASDVASLDALRAEGEPVPLQELEDRRAGLGPSSLATVIYTSGTTGSPKGCELTHGNFLAECSSAVEALPELFDSERASTLLFLPLAHVFGRMIQVACVMTGTTIGHSDVGRLTKDLGTFRPTFVLAVPRVFEKVFESARRKAVAAGRGRVFDLAADTAVRYSEALQDGAPGPLHRVRRQVFDALVYRKLRTALGGEVQWAVSGGAPLGARLAHFFRGAGVTVLEGYGLTETTAAATVNTARAIRIGTVGRPLPGFEVRTSADGEVLVRGGHVFRGYYGNPGATAEVLVDDGWFRTGDLGVVDADGYLTITGRAKEILVLSSGKNVAPAGLEDQVRSHPLVSQCVVLGDARPYPVALVTLDEESLPGWLQERGRAAATPAVLVEDAEVRAEVQRAVDRANASVSDAEAVRRFAVLAADFSEADGTLTPTLKVKRNVVLERHADVVERLYRAGGR